VWRNSRKPYRGEGTPQDGEPNDRLRKVEQGAEGPYQTLTLEDGTKLKYEPKEMIDAIFAAIEGRDHPLLLYIRRMDTDEGIPGLVRALEGNGDAERNGEHIESGG
jgi:hypothetical protein